MDKAAKKKGVERFRANREALVFVSCILLAMSIWFVNALSKSYTTTFEEQIIYKGLPASVSTSQLPHALSVEVSGKGFDLMQYSFSRKSSLVIIDIDKIPTTVFAGNPYAINTIQLLSELSKGLKNQIVFNQVIPEIILLNPHERFSRKIPVKAIFNYSFKKQYAQSSVLIIQPDSIYVTGDSSIINNIKEVNTEPANFELLDRTLFHSLKIKQPTNSKFSYSTDKVWVYMKVEPFTEGSVTIPVTVVNSGMKQITLVPDLVTVNYHVPLSLYNKIRPEQFEASTNLNSVNETSKIKVTIIRKPNEVSDVTVTPDQLDFFIKQN